jgi:hypothetical protein
MERSRLLLGLLFDSDPLWICLEGQEGGWFSQGALASKAVQAALAVERNLLGEEPYKNFTEWSKELGGLYSVQLGSKQLIVANDADLVKELFVDQQQYNSGKITGDLIEATMTDTGKTIGLGLPNENITDQKSSDH